MISKRQKIFLEKLKNGKEFGNVHRLVYLKRIQTRIDRELDELLWLAKNHPSIVLDVENRGNKRMKLILLTLKALINNPQINVELIKEVNQQK